MLIFALHFSATLRLVFSHPYVVFLGSISFPFYLIHSMLIRSILVWVIYGFIPDSGGLVARPSDDNESLVPKSSFWTFITVLVFPTWLAMVIYLSTLWRDHLDGYFVKFSQFIEEILVGKKTLFESTGTFLSAEGFKIGMPNGHQNRDIEGMEKGSRSS